MDWVIIFLIKGFFVFHVAVGLSAICTWIERKGSALLQDRIGANRAGAYFETDVLLLKPVFWFIRLAGVLGLINTLVCDGAKGLLKEDFLPDGTSNFMHSLGPFMAALPVFLAFAVIPVAPNFYIPVVDVFGFDFGGYQISGQMASLDAGVLFILAMGSIAVYGVIIAGWTGNNKFSMLGALRAAAQMISYELALGIVFATMIVVYGTLDLYEMVEIQKNGWGIISHWTAPVSFIIFFVVGMAETKRGPFDLPESESELVAGYFTEYSGMKFLLFWMGEFAEIGLFAILMVFLFFGGWHLPFIALPDNTILAAIAGHLILMGKVFFFCVLQIVIRWTLPRFRYDQLMHLGWKILLPISLVNLMVVAAMKIGGVLSPRSIFYLFG
jgi:NADH-quinone oxidoreductase subunit H